jgi:hypothetical protein
MPERPEPDLDRVREAMRDHDEREQEDRGTEEDAPPREPDDEPED